MKDRTIKIMKICCLSFLFSCIICGVTFGIYFGIKSKKDKVKKYEITEENKERVSLLQQYMILYGEKDIPELKDEEYNSATVSENKILSITKIEVNGNKGETIQIFKNNNSMALEDKEYSCISYKSNEIDYVVKINNGQFTIPNNLDSEVSETEFIFLLYFKYDPGEINEYEAKRSLDKENNNTSLVLYEKNNRKIIKRRLGILSKIGDFFHQSVETILEKGIGKLVSIVCVALIKYLCNDYSNVIVKSVGKFAFDEIGDFIGEGVTELIFNSDSKPAVNYKEIVYEEIKKHNFSQLPSEEAENLRNALKNDEYELIKIIVNTTNEDRQRIKKSYNSFYGDLIEDIKDELGSDFEDTVLALFYPTVDYDCFELKYAMKGLGTIEDILIEIIANRNNSVINQIKQRYAELYPGSNLIDDIIDDTSGYFKNTLVALLQEKRATNTEPYYEGCENSARILYAIKEKEIYMKIFTESSQADFIVIEDMYYTLAGETLLETVEDEFSGDFEDVLVGIYYAMINPAAYYAKKIHDSIYGWGTDDKTLIRALVTRYEEDMPLINEVYKKLYDADMIEDIKGDTRGSYQTLLVSLASGQYSKDSYLKFYIRDLLIQILCFIIFNL